jgi:hypothetical protein
MIKITNITGGRVIDVNAEIGGEKGFTLSAFNNAISDLPEDQTVIIKMKTNGGDVFEAFAIFDALRQLENRTEVDIIGASANDTPAITSVGANNTKLVAASGETTGLKWVGFQGASLSNSSTTVIPNNTYTTITFDGELIDTDGFHSTVTNTGRITIPTGLGGKYAITFNALIDPNATGLRQTRILKNGGGLYQTGEIVGVAGAYLYQNGAFVTSLADGDYIEFQVLQTSGGNLGYYARAGETPFTATFLGA